MLKRERTSSHINRLLAFPLSWVPHGYRCDKCVVHVAAWRRYTGGGVGRSWGRGGWVCLRPQVHQLYTPGRIWGPLTSILEHVCLYITGQYPPSREALNMDAWMDGDSLISIPCVGMTVPYSDKLYTSDGIVSRFL